LPLRAVISQLRAENEEAKYALEDDGGSTGEECKWYEHTRDMKAFSAKHPQILFTLSGEGGDAGDIWNEYFLDGKAQIAKAVMQIAAFDEKKLT
jgi:hypothetical protein